MYIDDFISSQQQPQLEDQQVTTPPVQPHPSHQPFSKQMSIEELSLWLMNHPEVGSDYRDDIDKLKGIYMYS